MLTGFDDPSMADFMAELDAVNATADAAPGFIWRFIEDDDGAEVRRVFGEEKLLFNLSVWDSVEALEAWAYSGNHLDIVRRRKKWFETQARSPLVLWWVESGHRPGAAEAKKHFDRLWEQGPSENAFTFRRRFPPP